MPNIWRLNDWVAKNGTALTKRGFAWWKGIMKWEKAEGSGFEMTASLLPSVFPTLKQIQGIMPDPGKCQYRGNEHDAPHGLVPAFFTEKVHGDQVECQRDDQAGPFAEVRCKTFAACATQHGEYFKNIENHHGADGRQQNAEYHTHPDFVAIDHNCKGISKRT